MTDILIDASALVVSADLAAPRIDRDALRMLAHLVDAGAHVTLTGHAGVVEHVGAGLLNDTRRHVNLHSGPLEEACPSEAAWVITGSQPVCDQLRAQRGTRTVLVGGAAGGAERLDRPADVLARTFTDAVLAVLADEAMGHGGPAEATGHGGAADHQAH